MNVREELAKVTLGQIVTGLVLLVGFLVLIIWRDSLSQKWAQVAEGVPRPTLMALLGLALIGLVLELGLIAYLLYLLYRRSRAPRPPEMTKRFGVLWDVGGQPHCPADRTLMRPRIHASKRDYDILECPKCDRTFPLKTEHQQSLLLPRAQGLVRDPYAKPEMLLLLGLRWDDQQNPHCPVDQMPLFVERAIMGSEKHRNHDILKCPKCKQEYPIRSRFLGLLTLYEAKDKIRNHLQRGTLELL